MSRSRVVFLLLSLAVLLPLVSGRLAARQGEDDADSLYKHLAVFTEVLNLVHQAYVEETSFDGLLAAALQGSTDALDPFATFVPASDRDSFLAAHEVGDRHSGLIVAKDGGIAFVVAVRPGGPAATLGIQRGDVLSQIDGRPTRPMALGDILTALAGEPGQRVRLEVRRQGASREVELVLAAHESPDTRLERPEGVPFLRFGDIEEETPVQVRGILEELAAEGDGGLLVDLRGVAGGEEESAYEVAGLFVQGFLGELKARQQTVERFAGTQPPLYRGRLVVLVDRSTMGAGEVLAEVLRQGTQATLVGETTFGHAGRMETVPLSTGDEIYLTSAFYAGPDGEPINEGLVPDEEVNSASRSFDDKDLPLDELILRRGLQVLREGTAEKAAA